MKRKLSPSVSAFAEKNQSVRYILMSNASQEILLSMAIQAMALIIDAGY